VGGNAQIAKKTHTHTNDEEGIFYVCMMAEKYKHTSDLEREREGEPI